ncbi:hypothetical protein [Mucilaginibacter sp. FT3.2]|uniref:hypothetical protein n=1 Tax=Mucilaginibacter sp. FT3.2 TaxID=2723090 RepID=UPI0016124E8F|nr:hypothetical protein [Mucilaginibacter sp. FT3.2]MBB6234332.1 hypothetical protein [Mucilaginibacter sp. FT3.2]
MNKNSEQSQNNRDKNRNDFDNNNNSFPGQKHDHLKKSGEAPDEIPEEHETNKEGSGYHSQAEVDQPDRGADTSYSEQTDVTPPNKKEFPSVGPSKTDFASRPQGRTTGRMVGHEPGTEGI